MEALSTKTKICNASIDLFSQKGYYKCGIREIASAANIRSSSIYNHFSSKDEILQEIFLIFEEEYKKYRTPVDEIIEMAKTKPLYEVFQKIFYTFGTNEEYNRIVRMAKIVTSMQYESKTAAKLYNEVFINEPIQYISDIAKGLMEINKIKELNYFYIGYMMSSFAFMMHQDEYINSYSMEEAYEKFEPMKEYVLKIWENIIAL